MYGSYLDNKSYSSLPNRDFFISRINSDIKLDSVKDYISNKNIKIIDIKLVSNKESKFKSYKLTVDINTANTILNASIWPYGVCISKWYSRKLPYNDTDSQVSNKYSIFSLR